jgi:hypothetical protein
LAGALAVFFLAGALTAFLAGAEAALAGADAAAGAEAVAAIALNAKAARTIAISFFMVFLYMNESLV